MSLDRNPRGVLRIGGVDGPELVHELDTPAYVYDVDAIAAGARQLDEAFEGTPHVIAYAVKANSAGAIVRTLADQGCGADVVSGAELLLALRCGVPPDRIVYSGVGKRDDEIDRALAASQRGIAAIQAESVEEVTRIEARARAAERVARVSLRVNPRLDLSGVTHASITTGHDAAKFGIPRDDVPAAIERVEASSHLSLVGLATHAGSQFMTQAPYLDAARVVFGLASGLRAEGRLRTLAFVDSGGGFGVSYDSPNPGDAPTSPLEGTSSSEGASRPLAPSDFVRSVRREQRRFGLTDLALVVEPGRSLVAAHGLLLARVVQRKVTSIGRWLVIDAGMNDLMRPALYQARHRIVAVERPSGEAACTYRVVGPVCESGDDFGWHRLPEDPGDAVAILDAGAYGFTMANVYNGRPLPAEGFVQGGRLASKTLRETVDAWVESRVRAGR